MAIEPISGAMSYQSINYAPPKTATESASTMDGDLQDISVNVDATTAAVAKTQESDKDGRDDGGNGAASEKENKEATEQLKKAISELNKKSENTQVQFGVHEKTNRITLKIVDKDTKDTIKEFPAEKTLDMIAKAWELAGLLVDEKR
ncbi:MAG: flagellar protein FlaG [Lachnospiraceae bacterium]|nr:flagellar protein FlaG [Candidatus Merdinaster equi]